MGLPLRQAAKIGAYVMKKHLSGGKYPLVLMLEPLFRCNLACAGCGKIDYPDEILNQRLSIKQCMDAIDECGAPAVSIAGGEPLLHRDMPKIVQGFLERDKFVILCTNALLLAKKIDQYKPDPNFTWSIHLDGDQVMHDKSVCLDGVYEKAVAAIKLAKATGFRTQINCTLFDGADPERTATLLRRDDGDGRWTASRSRPAMPMSARPTSSISSIANAPRRCSARSSRAATAARIGTSPIRPCSWTSWRATRPMNARPGRCRSAPSSAGRSPVTSWAKAM